MAFIRRRLGRGAAAPAEPPSDEPPFEAALVPVGPPRRPRPTLAVELPLPDDVPPPPDARGRELESE